MVQKLLKRTALDDGYAYSSDHTMLIKKFHKVIKYPTGVAHCYKIWLCIQENYPKLKGKRNITLGIYHQYGEEILQSFSKWWHNDYNKGKKLLRIRPNTFMNPSQAFKEQKARGFKHRNDMVGFDTNSNHIISITNKDYIIPINFKVGWPDKGSKLPEIHRAQYLYGVSGFTKVEYARST